MQAFLDPAILFFVLGLVGGLVRSNLEIPPAVARFLALYLLMALGLKGGFALAQSGLTRDVAASLGSAVLLAIVIPIGAYALLRRLAPPFDAIALSATYGSVSAVTFITAVQFLETRGTPASGHMAAALALMESPAIILAVVLANLHRNRLARDSEFGAGLPTKAPGGGLGRVLHESFTDGGQILLLGAMAVGLLSGAKGAATMQPFTGDIFKGMLAFFLLDMGLMTARHIGTLRTVSPWLLLYATAAPIVHALGALAIASIAGISVPDATLLAVLAASASYIAVPAVLREAIPEARPALYFGLSLGLTFPLNILFGIPLYAWMAERLL